MHMCVGWEVTTESSYTATGTKNGIKSLVLWLIQIHDYGFLSILKPQTGVPLIGGQKTSTVQPQPLKAESPLMQPPLKAEENISEGSV